MFFCGFGVEKITRQVPGTMAKIYVLCIQWREAIHTLSGGSKKAAANPFPESASRIGCLYLLPAEAWRVCESSDTKVEMNEASERTALTPPSNHSTIRFWLGFKIYPFMAPRSLVVHEHQEMIVH